VFKDSIGDGRFQGAGIHSLIIQGKFQAFFDLTLERQEVATPLGLPQFVPYLMASRGNALITANELGKAKDVFNDIINTSENIIGDAYHPSPILSHYYLAYINILEKDFDAAKEKIDQFIEKIRSDPNEFRFDNYILFIQAELNLIQGKLDLVQDLLDQVDIVGRERTPSYHSLLYRLYWAQGKYEQALDLLNPYYKNRQRAEIDPAVYAREMLFSEYHTGRIYEDMGDANKAIEYYQLSLGRMKDSDPGISEKEDAQARIKKLREL